MSHPDPGTVYRDADGRPMLFVRSEQRPGAKRPEHLFVHILARNVAQTWLSEAPDKAKLVIDTEGRKQANELRWLLEAEKHDKAILFGLLTRACSWLPAERVAELHAAWFASQP